MQKKPDLIFQEIHLEPGFGQHKPFLIGVTGASGAGKTTFSLLLKKWLLEKYPAHTVTIISTDSFIYTNQFLKDHQLIDRKGFPESFDGAQLETFLSQLKTIHVSPHQPLTLPFYCQTQKDIDPSQQIIISPADIYIIEGVSLFFSYPSHYDPQKKFSPCEALDYCIYLEEDLNKIKERSLNRFYQAFKKAQVTPTPYFEALKAEGYTLDNVAPHVEAIWKKMDVALFKEYIEPYKHLANCVIKGVPDVANTMDSPLPVKGGLGRV